MQVPALNRCTLNSVKVEMRCYLTIEEGVINGEYARTQRLGSPPSIQTRGAYSCSYEKSNSRIRFATSIVLAAASNLMRRSAAHCLQRCVLLARYKHFDPHNGRGTIVGISL
jgi:hypothetical protein